ncbi:MAG: hypothetical protein M1827_000887 [Pycnora praestabilis]|nr:MAG: hypothetical protein M1827_000887 [Pycnora praestabilis]
MSPEPTVRSNDLAFAVHAIVLSGLTYTQFWPLLWGFDVGSRQRVSAPIAGIFWGSLVGVALVIIIIASKGGNCGEDASSWAWIDAIYAIGYVKLIITMVKYVPQAWVNYKRKSTAGWSIYQILFDFTGGILSILQLVIDASLQDDWSGITGNPVKLGLGNISIFWNIIFIVQHYWLYHIKEEEKAVVQSTNGEQQPLLATRDEERANST